MANVFNFKKIKTIDKNRKIRPINVAHSLIPIVRRDKNQPIETVLFHKNLSGHILLALNSQNEPVSAWRDIDAIVPIKSSLVINSDRFKQIVLNLKPKKVFLNDGILLGQLPQCQLFVYSNKTLLQILNEIRLEKQPFSKKDNNIPTFKDMQMLEPNMTRKEYNIFCRNLCTQH